MKILVLNMTRFGDLIQGQAAVRGLARTGSVELVCLENFASAAGLLDRVNEVHALPGAGFLADLDRSWPSGLGRLSRFLDQVAATGPADLVVNLTPSHPARLLCSRLGATVRGFAMDGHGFNADTSAWAAFLQMASGNRGASPFNVIDLFTRVAGVDPKDTDSSLSRPGPEDLAAARELLPNDDYVGFQLGASEDRRRWPVERFAAVARGLHERAGLTPVLLGTEGELPLGERFLDMVGKGAGDLAGATVNLMGRTGLSELAGVLTRLAFLVTNDTGTMHLAAGLGVPCLAVFLATAQPFDTGPGLPGSICFEPDMDCHPCAFGRDCDRGHACRQAVPVQAVLEHALALAGEGDVPGAIPGARVWRTVRDPEGFLDLESLSGHEATDRVRWIRVQRAFYRRFLDEQPPNPSGYGPHGLSPEAATGLRTALSGARDGLFLLSQQAELLLMAPREALKKKFLASWQRVESLLRVDSRLDVLASMWRFQSQTAGGDLPSVAALADRYLSLLDSLLALFPGDGTEFE